MPGTVRIWWHDGTANDVRNNSMPIVSEPELGFESVAISTTPAASGAAPENATVALIESDIAIRYRVRRPADVTPASASDCKPVPATSGRVEVIGVRPGCSISLIEA